MIPNVNEHVRIIYYLVCMALHAGCRIEVMLGDDVLHLNTFHTTDVSRRQTFYNIFENVKILEFSDCFLESP